MYMVGMLLAIIFIMAIIAQQTQESNSVAVNVNDAAPYQVSDVVVLDTGCRGYAPIGTLSDGGSRVLQLYGRQCRMNRDRFNYYTMVDESRIPVELKFNGRRCETDGIGCDRVYSGDEMTATEFGTSAPLKVQLYGE